MSKRLILILALAFVVGISAAAFAEVQNVKVSGDLTVMGVARDHIGLAKDYTTSNANERTIGLLNIGTDNSDKTKDVLSIARVRVDADLTDNVTASVRLLNERNWNGESNALGTNNVNVFPNTTLANTVDEDTINLDLAYVTMKEFLYSPLSFTIGRQELKFGNKLIVGDPDTNIYATRSALAEGDLSARKSFDAVRATLDYNPLVLDLVYAKIEEGNSNLNDDVTLSGVNANYALSKNTTLEGFFFSKVKGQDAAAVQNLDTAGNTIFVNPHPNTGVSQKTDADQVYAVGGRVVNKTIKNLSVDAQAAYQFGKYNPKFDTNAKGTITGGNQPVPIREAADRSAWAAQVLASYDLKDISMLSKYSPLLSAGYTYLSGARRDAVGDKTYNGWDPMFEDQTFGNLMNAIIANSNMHRVNFSAKAKLVDDLSLNLDYVIAWFAKRYPEGRLAVLSGVATTAATGRQFRMGKEAYIGQEIDATLTYDYTEDVQFSLLGGLFVPGKSINKGYYLGGANTDAPAQGLDRAAAGEVIGSMKVTF